MQFEIVLSRNGYKQALEVIADTFKNWKVWKVRFQDGREAVLFKCGSIWLQRNEDALENWLLNAIGERIDRMNLRLALS
jgi:hypothetical protein